MTTPPTSQRRFRIRRWYGKAIYLVIAAVLVFLIAAVPTGTGGGGVLRSALAFVLVLLAARLFRGAGEEVVPPRPWWRMTADVTAGVVLGSLVALIAIASAVGYLGLSTASLAHKDVADLPSLIVTTVLCAVLAYLYFGSSRRLVLARRAQAAEAAHVADAAPGRPS